MNYLLHVGLMLTIIRMFIILFLVRIGNILVIFEINQWALLSIECPCIFSSHSVHRPPLLSAGGLNLLPNFQKGGAWQELNFEKGVAGKEGVTFFRVVAIFTKKINLNQKFWTKKFYKYNYFSLSIKSKCKYKIYKKVQIQVKHA